MLLNAVLLVAFAPLEVTAAALRQEPIPTDVIVPEAEWGGYNTCPEEHCKCKNPQAFEIRMCKSFTCTACVDDFCVKSCQDLQAQYPTCRCPDWPESRASYSDSSSHLEGAGESAGKGESEEAIPLTYTFVGAGHCMTDGNGDFDPKVSEWQNHFKVADDVEDCEALCNDNLEPDSEGKRCFAFTYKNFYPDEHKGDCFLWGGSAPPTMNDGGDWFGWTHQYSGKTAGGENGCYLASF